MTLMTPIPETTPATAIPHPEAGRAERLAACSAAVCEMLAEAARMLDLAASLSRESRSGLHQQARLRMTGAALLLAEMDTHGENFGCTIMSEIIDIADTPDADLVRDLAERLDAAIGIELHSIKIGELWDRYET